MTTLIETKSEEETIKLGEKIGVKLKRGDIVSLVGDLGAGKTYLTKGIVKSLNVKTGAKSPTFVIINEYKGDLPVYHFDCYRIKGKDELERLGYEEYFYGNGVTVIEWADKVAELIPKNAVRIEIGITGKNERKFKIENLIIK